MKKLKSGATDDNGRLRLHGAFTGGFSAGYFNTVGTVEGFKPATFVSSRSQRAEVQKKSVKDYMEESDDSSDDEDRKVDELAVKNGLIDDGTVIPPISRQQQSETEVLEERSLLLDAKSSHSLKTKAKKDHAVYRVDDIMSVGLRPEKIKQEDSTAAVVADKPSARSRLTSSNGYLNEEEADNVYENDRDNESRIYHRLADDTLVSSSSNRRTRRGALDEEEAEIESHLGSHRFKDSVLSRINENIDQWLGGSEAPSSVVAATARQNSSKPAPPAAVPAAEVFVRPASLRHVDQSDPTDRSEEQEVPPVPGSVFDLMPAGSRARLSHFLQRQKDSSSSKRQTRNNEKEEEEATQATAVTVSVPPATTTTAAAAARPLLVSPYQSSLASFVALNQSFKSRFTSSTGSSSAVDQAAAAAAPREGLTTAAELREKANQAASTELLSSLLAQDSATSAPAPAAATARLVNKRSTVMWAPHSLLCKRMNIKPPEATTATSSTSSSSSSRTDVRIDSMLDLIQKSEDTSYTVITTETDKKWRQQQQQQQQQKEKKVVVDEDETETAAGGGGIAGDNPPTAAAATSQYKLSRAEKKRLHDQAKRLRETAAETAAAVAAAAAAAAAVGEQETQQQQQQQHRHQSLRSEGGAAASEEDKPAAAAEAAAVEEEEVSWQVDRHSATFSVAPAAAPPPLAPSEVSGGCGSGVISFVSRSQRQQIRNTTVAGAAAVGVKRGAVRVPQLQSYQSDNTEEVEVDEGDVDGLTETKQAAAAVSVSGVTPETFTSAAASGHSAVIGDAGDDSDDDPLRGGRRRFTNSSTTKDKKQQQQRKEEEGKADSNTSSAGTERKRRRFIVTAPAVPLPGITEHTTTGSAAAAAASDGHGMNQSSSSHQVADEAEIASAAGVSVGDVMVDASDAVTEAAVAVGQRLQQQQHLHNPTAAAAPPVSDSHSYSSSSVNEPSASASAAAASSVEATAEAFLLSLAAEQKQNTAAAATEPGTTTTAAAAAGSEIERLIANYNQSIRQFRESATATAASTATAAAQSSESGAAAAASQKADLFSDMFRSVPWASSSSSSSSSAVPPPPPPTAAAAAAARLPEKRKFDSILHKLHSQLVSEDSHSSSGNDSSSSSGSSSSSSDSEESEADGKRKKKDSKKHRHHRHHHQHHKKHKKERSKKDHKKHRKGEKKDKKDKKHHRNH